MSKVRLVLVLVAACFALPLAAQNQFTYIIPVYGDVRGVDADFEAQMTVTNLSSSEATVRIGKIYTGSASCQGQIDAQVKIPGTETRAWFDLICTGLASFTLISNQPLSITNDIVAKAFGPIDLETRQGIDIRSEWLPAGRTFLFPNVELLSGQDQARANLFLVNPNTTPLTVTVTTRRPTNSIPRFSFLEKSVTVAPESIAVVALQEAPDPGTCHFGANCQVNHQVLVNASGQFYVGVSSLRFVHGYWRNPTQLR